MNSYIYDFKDLPSTDTPFNAETMAAMQNKLLDSIYPIGSIIIKDDATDYSSYLGFTWEKVFAGVTLVGLDTTQTEFNEIGKKGGEKEHVLTIDEMPSHRHKQALIGSNQAPDGAAYNWVNSNNNRYLYEGDDLAIASGGGQAHNNLQPYQVVAYWKRVA